MHFLFSLWLWIGCFVCLWLVVVMVEGSSQNNANQTIDVLAYFCCYPNHLASLEREKDRLKYVSYDLYGINVKGNVNGEKDVKAFNLMENRAERFATLANIDFVTKIVSKVLDDASIKNKLLQKVTAWLDEGYEGFNLDFEGVDRKYRTKFTMFIDTLRTTISNHSPSKKLVISMPALTEDSPSDDWGGAFDYVQIGKAVDIAQIMTYDEHGPWSNPGPISSFPWFKQCLDYAITTMPFQKVSMGLPAYGYDWDLTNNRAKTVLLKQIPAIMKKYNVKKMLWDDGAKTPFFRYRDFRGNRHVIHCENATSIQWKVKYAKQKNVGVSVWALGQEPDWYYDAIYNAS